MGFFLLRDQLNTISYWQNPWNCFISQGISYEWLIPPLFQNFTIPSGLVYDKLSVVSSSFFTTLPTIAVKTGFETAVQLRTSGTLFLGMKLSVQVSGHFGSASYASPLVVGSTNSSLLSSGAGRFLFGRLVSISVEISSLMSAYALPLRLPTKQIWNSSILIKPKG